MVTQLPRKGHSSLYPSFRPTSVVAKRSPISTTAEHLVVIKLQYLRNNDTRQRYSYRVSLIGSCMLPIKWHQYQWSGLRLHPLSVWNLSGEILLHVYVGQELQSILCLECQFLHQKQVTCQGYNLQAVMCTVQAVIFCNRCNIERRDVTNTDH